MPIEPLLAGALTELCAGKLSLLGHAFVRMCKGKPGPVPALLFIGVG